MIEQIRHNCGICVAHSLHDAYSLIRRLQHRGREAAGIAFIGDGRIDAVKWVGNVDRFDLEDLHKIFPGHRYHTYMAHVRYATRGRKEQEQILKDAHPHVVGGELYHRGDHIFVMGCDKAIVHNGQVERRFLEGVDSDCLDTGCDSEALLHLYADILEKEFLRRVPGAYTLAIADRQRKDVMVMRDRTGIRPGVLGMKDGKFAVASEDIALRKTGAEVLEDLDPGSVYYLTPCGDYRRQKVVDSLPAFCFFEYNYIAHHESILNSVPVRNVREALGDRCALEHPLRGSDLVIYAPRCPKLAARRYAKALDVPFVEDVLYKMRGERSFQGSTSAERECSIKNNMHLAPEAASVLRGKRVVALDDSTIRANTAGRFTALMDEAEVAHAILLNYTPPIGIIGDDGEPRGCVSGVDMPPDDNFIARGRTLDEIREKVGIDVRYISLEGMLEEYERLGISRDDLCTFCIGGPDPFRDF